MAVMSNPVQIRPGDLLDGGSAEAHLGISSRDIGSMNSIGALVGCCDVTTPVFANWSIRQLQEYITDGNRRAHVAVVFGRRDIVNARYLDIHRQCGMRLGAIRRRIIELPNESMLVFVYIEDDYERMRGCHFNSVWLATDGVRAAIRHSSPADIGAQFRESVARGQFGPSRIDNELPSAVARLRERLGQIRSGYRGEVRAQFREFGESVDEREARRLLGGEDVPRTVETATEADVRQQREWTQQQELLRVRQAMQAEIERLNASTRVHSATGLVMGVDLAFPNDSIALVGESAANSIMVTNVLKPESSEPVRFPERRKFLTEDDE